MKEIHSDGLRPIRPLDDANDISKVTAFTMRSTIENAMDIVKKIGRNRSEC